MIWLFASNPAEPLFPVARAPAMAVGRGHEADFDGTVRAYRKRILGTIA